MEGMSSGDGTESFFECWRVFAETHEHKTMEDRTSHGLEPEIGFVKIFGFPHARRELEFSVVLVRPGVVWTHEAKFGPFTHLAWNNLSEYCHFCYSYLCAIQK